MRKFLFFLFYETCGKFATKKDFFFSSPVEGLRGLLQQNTKQQTTRLSILLLLFLFEFFFVFVFFALKKISERVIATVCSAKTTRCSASECCLKKHKRRQQPKKKPFHFPIQTTTHFHFHFLQHTQLSI